MNPRPALDTLWTANGLAWTVIGGEALALILALAPGIEGDRLVWFGLNSMLVQWICLSTLGLLYLGKRRLARLKDGQLAVLGLSTLLLGTWLSVGLLWLAFSSPLRLTAGSWPELLLLSTSLALTVGLIAIAAIQNHLRLQNLAVQATRAELQALQARIRPHFLFNTLNSAVALVRSEPARAENLLIDMADLFRSALSPASTISLAQEIDLCQRYIAIEQARFGDRLQTQWHLPDPLPALVIPPLCLQPLLENAVHHGVERSHRASLIQIIGDLQPGQMIISIRNPLHAEGTQHHHGHGVGLEAVRARLAAYSEQARLETSSADGHYLARLHLPLSDQVTTR
ncbi:histidine kinase [Stenotrophomonas sp. W1S232]|uniref:Histidine kinase n=1 Tax=Stenotrophomonas koreensis TaxID=266128 RepID=A0A7W3YTS6_9GAMM|nr:histidine kinase [Stenotrophomonas koreensis]MBB1116341.1 histidine kinase [Stenotrophomonas koreensis]